MTILTVPINLQALRVTETTTAQFAGPTTDFAELPYPGSGKQEGPNIADRVVRSLRTSSGTRLCLPGVHLHWQLPDAVARGRQQEDGTVRFPQAPDRWLVTRVLHAAHTDTAMQWVVESDRLFEPDDAAVDPSTNRKPPAAAPVGWDRADSSGKFVPYRHQGVTYRLEDWPPKGSALRVRDLAPKAAQRGLDARGHSGAGFAAYYQDCAGIFGFHDTLEDLLRPENATSESAISATSLFDLDFTVTYHVCGWHSRKDEDPLAGLAGDTGANPRLAELRTLWTLPEAGCALPERSLYAGSLHRLAWAPRPPGSTYEEQKTYPDTAPVPKALTVAIGSSTAEALAALLTTAPPANGWNALDMADVPAEIAKTPEYLLDALQLGLLQRVHPASALAELEVALHRQGFASLPGGFTWSLGAANEPREPNRQADGSRDIKGGGTTGGTPPKPMTESQVGDALTLLNTHQSELDALLRVIESLRRQLYLDWLHYHREMFGVSDAQDDFAQHLMAMTALLVNKAVAAWGGDEKARRFNSGDIVRQNQAPYWGAPDCTPDSASGKLAAEAAALESRLPPGFTLRRRDAPSFWQPQAPVFVMQGENLRPSNRNGSALPLACRLSDQLLRGQAPDGWPALRVPEAPAGDEKIALEPLQADMRSLLNEAGLLDLDPPRVDRNAPPPGCSGQPPAALGETRAAADPFLPLYLVWTATITPLAMTAEGDHKLCPPDLLEKQFVIDAGSVDFNPPGTLPLDAQSAELSGAALLTARAADPLAAQVRAYLDETGAEDAALAKLADEIRSWALLSQAAGGVNEMMLGCETGLQMAPFNPYAARPAKGDDITFERYFSKDHGYENSITWAVANCVGNRGMERPADRDTGSADFFSPLRSGLLEIKGLHVVDVFGRRLDLLADDADKRGSAAPRIVPSWRLVKPKGAAGNAFLPPRFAQPARLLLDWETPGADTPEDTGLPSASPIRGWIVPDHIDQSLMLFDADGTALCSIGMPGGHDKPMAQPPAGHGEGTLESYMAASNPHLRAFVELVMNLREPKESFAEFLVTLDDAADYTKPATAAAAQAQAVLMGRPLALVHAALRLELMGVPALNPSKARFVESATQKPAPLDKPVTDWKMRDHGGITALRVPVHLGDHNMIEDGLAAWVLDGRIYAPSAPKDGCFAVSREAPPLSLEVGTSDDAVPVWKVVPMLIDPLAAVHVSCGLLPVVRAALAPDMVAAALAKIELSLFTHPVLRPKAADALLADGGIALPLPAEAGREWGWVVGMKQGGMKQGGKEVPHQESAKPSMLADHARWGYSPLSIEDGWLILRNSGES